MGFQKASQRAITGGVEDFALGEKVWQCWHGGRDDSKVHFDDTCFFFSILH